MVKFKGKTTIQSVLFDKQKWTSARAKKWLKRHGMLAPISDTTEAYYRFRQSDPSNFDKETFRTISLGYIGDGIKAVIGVPLRDNPTSVIVKNVKLKKNEVAHVEWDED